MVQLSSKLCCVYFTFVGEENVGDTEWTAVWETDFVIKRGLCKNTKKVSNGGIDNYGRKPFSAVTGW